MDEGTFDMQVAWLAPAHKANPFQMIKRCGLSRMPVAISAARRRECRRGTKCRRTDGGRRRQSRCGTGGGRAGQGRAESARGPCAQPVAPPPPAKPNFFERLFGARRPAPTPTPPPARRRSSADNFLIRPAMNIPLHPDPAMHRKYSFQIYDRKGSKRILGLVFTQDRQQTDHQRRKTRAARRACSKTAGSKNTASSATPRATSSAASTKAASRTSRWASRRCSSTSASRKMPSSISGTPSPPRSTAASRKSTGPTRNSAEKADHGEGHPEHLPGRHRSDRAGDQRARSAPRARASRPISASPGAISCSCLQRSQRHLAQDRRSRRSAIACARFCANSTSRKAWASSSAPSAKASGRATSSAIWASCSSNGPRSSSRSRTEPAPCTRLRRARSRRAHRARFSHRRNRRSASATTRPRSSA